MSYLKRPRGYDDDDDSAQIRITGRVVYTRTHGLQWERACISDAQIRALRTLKDDGQQVWGDRCSGPRWQTISALLRRGLIKVTENLSYTEETRRGVSRKTVQARYALTNVGHQVAASEKKDRK